LTGARNRRAMSEELQMAVAAKQRSNTDFGVLAMDLDHFNRSMTALAITWVIGC